jgi:hypothetical protein
MIRSPIQRKTPLRVTDSHRTRRLGCPVAARVHCVGQGARMHSKQDGSQWHGVSGMNIIDHGEHDLIPYELGSWLPTSGKVRDCIELMTGRELTQMVQEPGTGWVVTREQA